MNTKERLLKFIDESNLNSRQVEVSSGIPNGTINNSKGEFNSGTILKIKNQYPNLDVNWLLTGKKTNIENDHMIYDVLESIKQNEVKVIANKTADFIAEKLSSNRETEIFNIIFYCNIELLDTVSKSLGNISNVDYKKEYFSLLEKYTKLLEEIVKLKDKKTDVLLDNDAGFAAAK